MPSQEPPPDAPPGPGPEAVAAGRQLSVCLISPRFEPSFWGKEYVVEIERGPGNCNMINGALPLLAALVPAGHHVEILDENVEPIDFDDLDRFDLIGVTGMIVQKRRMREILLRLKGRRPVVCVGGPYATVDERFFDGLCDVLFIGEAEETWPAFLRDLAAGRPTRRRYEQAEKTDMSTVPVPRYDLMRRDRYACAPVQFSRGCPFLCEFCDIIVIFGRRPRVKRPEQVIAELEAVMKAGVDRVFIVDDNFIGNKKEAKRLLHALVAWQERNGFPLIFFTEASVNLADDAELMDLMFRANFRQVFFGIESPRPSSLKETKKVQNVAGDSLEAKLTRIREAGITPTAGFIVGFDNDDERIFDEQFDFIQRNGIGFAGVAILSPIPTTPLYARLEKEGRLVMDDEMVWFEPKRMSREALKQGFSTLTRRLYEPEAFFERLFRGYEGSAEFRRKRQATAWRDRVRRGPTDRLRAAAKMLAVLGRFSRALSREGRLLAFGARYLRIYRAQRRQLGADALGFPTFLSLCAQHWHHYKVAAASIAYFGRAGEAPGTAPHAADPVPAAVQG